MSLRCEAKTCSVIWSFSYKLSGSDGITPAFIILYLLSHYIRNDAYTLFRPCRGLFQKYFYKKPFIRQTAVYRTELDPGIGVSSYACVSLRYFYLITIINQFSTDGFFLPVECFRQEDCSHVHDSTSVPSAMGGHDA